MTEVQQFLLLPSALNKTVLLITHPMKYYSVIFNLIKKLSWIGLTK